MMELLILVDALKGLFKIRKLVIPYYGYARQDRKTRARDDYRQVSSRSNYAAGANRIVAMDLHAGQIQGFFNIPFDHLTAIPILANFLIPSISIAA